MILHVSYPINQVYAQWFLDTQQGRYVEPAIWSLAEPCMGVVSACLPSLHPLISIAFRGRFAAFGSGNATNNGTQGSNARPSAFTRKAREEDLSVGSFQRILDSKDNRHLLRPDDSSEATNKYGNKVSVHGGRAHGRGQEGLDDISLEDMNLNLPMGRIGVKEEVVVVSSDWMEYQSRLF